MSSIIVDFIYHLTADLIFYCTVHWCLGIEECDAHYGVWRFEHCRTGYCKLSSYIQMFCIQRTEYLGNSALCPGYKWIVYYICIYVMYVIFKLVN